MDNGQIVIYTDIFIVTVGANMLFDWLLLWATAEVTRTPTSGRRLVAGALMGTLHFIAYTMASYGLVGFYGLLRHPAVLGIVSLAMLAVAFPRPQLFKRLRLIGTFYIVLSIAAGAGLAAGNLFSGPNGPNVLVAHIGALSALLLVAELGWGVVQRRVWRGLYHVKLDIQLLDHCSHVTALIDTGHRLTDPLSGLPVIVVERHVIEDMLPTPVRQQLAPWLSGDLNNVPGNLPDAWASRMRLIPFSSLGQQHGMLIGFKTDAVTIQLPALAHIPQQAVVAIAEHPLDPSEEFQALISPELLEAAHNGHPDSGEQPTSESPRGAYPIHADRGGNKIVDTTH